MTIIICGPAASGKTYLSQKLEILIANVMLFDGITDDREIEEIAERRSPINHCNSIVCCQHHCLITRDDCVIINLAGND